MKGEWHHFPTFEQRLLAFYTLSFPTVQAGLGLYSLLAVVMMFTVKTPVVAAITLFLPFYLLAAHFSLSVFGLYDFAAAHWLKPRWPNPLLMAPPYLPYQWAPSYAPLRAD